MFEKLIIKTIIKKNRKSNKEYYEFFKDNEDFLYIKSKYDLRFLYLAPKFHGITLGIKHDELFDKKLIKGIIECFPNTEIELYEKEQLFSNDDIKELYNLNKKIIVNTEYFEKNLNGKNEIYSCDISTYILIIQKIEYLLNICKNNFNSQIEQFMFIFTQILKYIKYIDYHDYRTCMANSILLGTGVCIDFTIALCKCLNDIGIKCEIVTGIGVGQKEDINSRVNISLKKSHAWNQVMIDDKWYNVDITWFLDNNNFDWLLSNDEIFTQDYKHLTNKKDHYCRINYNKKEIKKLYEKFMKYDSVWKRFDNSRKNVIINLETNLYRLEEEILEENMIPIIRKHFSFIQRFFTKRYEYQK